MEIMYVKYVNGKRHSIIKEGGNIIMNDSKIIPLDSITKEKEHTDAPYKKSKVNTPNYNSDDIINEKITKYFFDAIHKNYKLNRQK